jgi:hypothetical protein
VTEFTNRGLSLSHVTDKQSAESEFREARGLVLYFAGDAAGSVRSLAQDVVENAIDHGILLYVFAENDQLQGYAQTVIDALNVPGVRSRTAPIADFEIAETMSHWGAKRPSPASLEIMVDPETVAPSGADELLLRRAFSDCSKIQISSMSGGRTADTYMVEATFAGSLVGPRPLPFFAKLGSREKIDLEVKRYRDFATHYIPFHLRPNLDDSRCLLGFNRGILVGNFVELAEPLWNAARKGRASGAIHSLIDVTLAGWRAQGFERGLVKNRAVAGALGPEIFDFEKVQKEHLEAAQELGLSRSPQELWESLIGRTEQCYYQAPMHGDLHPGNVFVRGGDAILIDLASVKDGPLSGDLACLETSLIFEPQGKLPDRATWEESVGELYSSECFQRLPPPIALTDEWSSLWNSARMVRMAALPTQACPTEYACAVAVYLLRRAMYPGDSAEDRFRRAYSLVVADRVISEAVAIQ